MKKRWLLFLCAVPLWGQTALKDLQADVDYIRSKAEETEAYYRVYTLGASFFAEENRPAESKIKLVQVVVLPVLDEILSNFTLMKTGVHTPEGETLVEMNRSVVEKLKEAYLLYAQGLKNGDENLKARANVMAAVEAPALAAESEAYFARLGEKYPLVCR